LWQHGSANVDTVIWIRRAWIRWFGSADLDQGSESTGLDPLINPLIWIKVLNPLDWVSWGWIRWSGAAGLALLVLITFLLDPIVWIHLHPLI
jgi:hypothetical protein